MLPFEHLDDLQEASLIHPNPTRASDRFFADMVVSRRDTKKARIDLENLQGEKKLVRSAAESPGYDRKRSPSILYSTEAQWPIAVANSPRGTVDLAWFLLLSHKSFACMQERGANNGQFARLGLTKQEIYPHRSGRSLLRFTHMGGANIHASRSLL